MARILVAGASAGLPQTALLQRLVARVREDGHDGVLYGTHEEPPLAAVKGTDAVVAVLDAADARTAALVAFAHALKKPCLGLHGPRPADPLLVAACTMLRPGVDEADWLGGLKPFYEHVRPFAGRLVRDLVPRLVQEAGHEVTFRELPPDDRPRHLKQKVLEEAQELAEAGVGDEKEEIADLLEALETLIRVRDVPREDLKAVKDGKRKRRGGFERFYVVEASAGAGTVAPVPAASATPGGPAATPARTPSTAPTPAASPAAAPVGDLATGGRRVEPRFFEI